MSDPKQPIFLVSAYSEPVVVRINGKANYLNCNAFREFTEKMIADGKHHFVIDFENCKGMDSTFLGILAGTALELRGKSPPGSLLICNLGERNHELICNLGLQNILTIGEGSAALSDPPFDSLEKSKVSSAENILKAHEALVAADGENAAKFQDVIAFLRNQVDSENS